MAKQNNNKKWIIGGSITLLVLLGLSLGTGALIGYYEKDEDDYIKIHTGDTYYEDKIDLGTDSTSDEEKAKLLERQFYSASLFGSFEGAVEDGSDSAIYNATGADWNLPYIVTNAIVTSNANLQDNFVIVKFLSDTEDSSVYTFLSGMVSTSDEPMLVIEAIAQLKTDAEAAGVPFPSVTGLDIINNDSFTTTRDLIYNLLTTDMSYIKEVQKDILVYTYLWQDSPQSAYDYILTRELVYSTPSMVYSFKIDGENFENSGSSLLGVIDSDDLVDHTVDATTWNTWISTLKGEEDVLIDDTIDEDYILDAGNMQGYQGIKFGTSAGSMIASDWTRWDNTWVADETVAAGETVTNVGEYTHSDILSTANLYLADSANGADGKGATIYDTSTDSSDPIFGNAAGERYVYAYNQLYPYMFREVEVEGVNAELGNEQFSLFANTTDSISYTPGTTDEHTTYIFDEWFSTDAVKGEIYIAEAIVKNNSSLTSKALRYWNNQGFYIELSGSYEDDLASFLPTEILFNE